MIKYGIDKNTNAIVFIRDADRGLKCNCKCIECGKDLVANQGEVNDWYFDHYIKSNCAGGVETAIHKLAKEIISKETKILTPKGYVEYSDVEIEKDLNFICPDISINSEGNRIFIEIFVTNKKKEKQISIYNKHKLKSFEIDLSTVPYDISPEELEPIVLNNEVNRKLLYWKKNTEAALAINEKKESNISSSIITFFKSSPAAVLVLCSLIVFLIYKIFFQKRASVKRRFI
jgi:hypothetical protein